MPVTQQRGKLRRTHWLQGPEKSSPPSVFEAPNSGGWESLEKFKKTRLRECRALTEKKPLHRFLSKVDEIEFGYRTEEPLSGSLEGFTEINVVEIIAERRAVLSKDGK